MDDNKQVEINKLYKELVELKNSPLYSYRIKNKFLPVIGQGNPDASVVFVGEAPGKNEAFTGIPFSGAAGKVLDALLASVMLRREDIFITSIVNDKPPNNRDPKPEEIALYSPFLMKLLNIIQPSIIVSLGRYSTQFLLQKFNAEEKEESITNLHGKIIDCYAPFGKVQVLPMYHPAVVLYKYSMKPVIEEDFKILLELDTDV